MLASTWALSSGIRRLCHFWCSALSHVPWTNSIQIHRVLQQHPPLLQCVACSNADSLTQCTYRLQIIRWNGSTASHTTFQNKMIRVRQNVLLPKPQEHAGKLSTLKCCMTNATTTRLCGRRTMSRSHGVCCGQNQPQPHKSDVPQTVCHINIVC